MVEMKKGIHLVRYTLLINFIMQLRCPSTEIFEYTKRYLPGISQR